MREMTRNQSPKTSAMVEKPLMKQECQKDNNYSTHPQFPLAFVLATISRVIYVLRESKSQTKINTKEFCKLVQIIEK